MVTTLQDIQTHAAQPQGAQYRYDQLNRIKEMQVWQNMDVINNQWQSGASLSDYRTSYRYDANGNILNLNRNGHNSVNLAMDSLSYHYIAGTNRLAYVDDAVASGNYSVDIDDQAVGNYAYDATGNLIKDVAEEIDSIVWTAYGKVLRVVRSSVSSKPDLHFAYGPDGNRLSKKAVYGNDSTVWTFYVRDAQGNTMATYRHKESSGVLHLTDHVMYGSSRLGSHERKQVELLGAGSSPITARAGIFGLERGDKRYELSNHLGNVLTVVSDRRAKASCADTLVSGYWADVVSTNDYYPFGMGMVERGDDGGYRYGFNGQERDDEVAGAGNSYTAEFWQYDVRLGRRWNVDPVVKTYASNYSVFSNNPLTMVDPDGAADFYNEAGVKVGTDGNPDGIIYILTSEADIKKAMHSYYGRGILGFFRQVFGTKGKGTIQRDAFSGDVYALPPPKVRQAMIGAVNASNGPSGLDEEGGFHEEGGYWGLDKNGNMVVVPAKPGPWTDPSVKGAKAELDPFDAADEKLAATVVTKLGTYHVHPSGKLAIEVKANNETSNVSSIGFQAEQTLYRVFDQHPSRTDVTNAGERNLEINFVLGARNGTIYIYGSEGQNTRQSRDPDERIFNSHKATFPIEKFKELTPE